MQYTILCYKIYSAWYKDKQNDYALAIYTVRWWNKRKIQRQMKPQIVRLQDTINKYNNNRGYSVAVFIDFQSAYDMLWHHGLFCKLLKMGINGRMFTYIQQFLTKRTMQVRIGNKLSETHCLENGTPQGSIISPLLFLIMINDLPNKIKDTETTLFADDSCMFKSGNNLDVIVRKFVEKCKAA